MDSRVWGWAFGLAMGIAAQAASAQSTMISDFENQSATNNLGGYWYFYDDNTDSGESVLTTVDSITKFWDTTTFAAGAEGSASAVKLGFILGTKEPVCGENCSYPPLVGMGTDLKTGGQMDLTGATSISFWAKGDAAMQVGFAVGTADVKDNGNYSKLIAVTTAWKKFTVALPPAAGLEQPGWATQVEFDPAKATSLGWAISKGDNPGLKNGALYLDNVVIEGWTVPEEPIALRGLRERARSASATVGGRRARVVLFTTGAGGAVGTDAMGRGLPATRR